jgi:hypothetical protein
MDDQNRVREDAMYIFLVFLSLEAARKVRRREPVP